MSYFMVDFEFDIATIPAALADPDVPLDVIICIGDYIDLDIIKENLAPFRQRLIASVKWMQQRHDNFTGEAELKVI